MSALAVRPRASLAVVAAMATVYLVWGSTYLAIRVMVETIPPVLAGSLRFLLAGAVLAGVLAATGRWQRPTRRELVGASLFGCWLLIGGVGGVTLVETRVPSNVAAVVASTAALWVIVFRLLARERVRRPVLAGAIVGFAGIALLLLPAAGDTGAPTVWLVGSLLSPLAWASGSFYGPRLLALPADAFVASAVEMLAAGVVQLPIALALGDLGDTHASDVSLRSGAAIAYLVVASIVAFSAYVWLLEKLPISTVVTHQFVNPTVAVALGWLVLSEPLTPLMLVAMTIIIGAVCVIVRSSTGQSSQSERAASQASAGVDSSIGT